MDPLPAEPPRTEHGDPADRLLGSALPAVALEATDGSIVRLDRLPPGRTVVYLYPRTGDPEGGSPPGWDDIPGARGCTSEACGFRDHLADLRSAGAGAVYGLSSQDTAYQAEAAGRLRLPFPLLSDPGLGLADALGLPTFSAPGHARLYTRITLVVADGLVEHVFFPVDQPGTHAQQVLTWLRRHPRSD